MTNPPAADEPSGPDPGKPDRENAPLPADPSEVHPIVVPPRRAGDPFRWGGAWRPRWRFLLAAVLAGALGALILRFGLETGAGGLLAVSGAASDGGLWEGTPAAPSFSSSARFRRLADSVAATLARYERRRVDFEANRIGCEALLTGYRPLDRSFVALSRVFLEANGTGHPALRTRFEALADGVDRATRHFDGTGCRREP